MGCGLDNVVIFGWGCLLDIVPIGRADITWMDFYFFSKKISITSQHRTFHHDTNANAATVRLPTYSNASSLRLFFFAEIYQFWRIESYSVVRTNIAMSNKHINDEKIGISAINITMAFRSDVKVQHLRSPLVVHIC